MSTKWTVGIVVFLMVAIATALIARHFQRDSETIRIGEHTFRVLIADDAPERSRGLSGLPSLADDTVMLFVFPENGKHGIWMKDMQFSIDVLWLDDRGRIVHLERNIAPETYPEVFRPEKIAKYVIEMNAGLVGRYNIQLGTIVEAWPSG